MFEAVPQGERRYLDGKSTDPDLAKMPLGTVMTAQQGSFDHRFAAYIPVKALDSNQSLVLRRGTYLSQPLDRRRQPAEKREQIKKSESARNEHIIEMSQLMSTERAEEIIRAVLAAIYGKDVPLPENPFRKDDTFREAVAVVKGADLNNHLRLDHIPRHNDKGESCHIAYRKNVRTAVARLMGMKEHQE